MKPPRLDLNPSSAERWTTCTASPQFILENADKLPPSGSRFSEEGTTAHAVAAALLEGKPEPKGLTPPVDEAMRMHGWNYNEYVEALRAPSSMLLVEQKLELWYMAGRHAIVDAAVINPLNLHVIDYKYGEGVTVSPENNLQAVIYAYSVGKGQQLAKDHPVFIHIYQPRGRDSAGEPAKVWETTWGEVNRIAYDIECMSKIVIQQPVLVEFKPSEAACRWCPAKGFCSARQATLLEGLTTIEETPSLPVVTALTEHQRVLTEKHGSEIKKWVDDVQEYNLEQANAGNILPGFKLVMSKGGHRYWTDPVKAGKLLLSETHLRRDEVFEEKIISPKGAEDLLGKRKFSAEIVNLIGKPPGSPELAEVGDKREAIGESALEGLEVIQ